MDRIASLDILRTKLSTSELFKEGRWATAAEMDILMYLAEEANAEYIIECGTANGWTALNLSSIAPVITFDIIDRPKCYTTERITQLIGKFENRVSEIKEQVKGHRKMFFIDGEHEGGAPTRDYEACLPLIEQGDILAFHDFQGRAVQRAVGRVEGHFPWWTKRVFREIKHPIAAFNITEHPAKDLNSLMEMIAGFRQKEGVKHGYWSGEAEYPILFSLVSKYKPDLIIETGTCAGASALTFALAAKLMSHQIEITTYDPKNVPKIYEQSPLKDNITYHQEEFKGKKLSTFTQKMFFIDGDHTKEGCLADLNEAMKTVIREGDVIVIHDAQRIEVKEAIAEFFKIHGIKNKDYVIPSVNHIHVIEF